MNKLANLLSLLPLLFLSACASIVSKSRWPFSVMTEPPGAHVAITNKIGVEVYNGKTPMAIKLKSGASFFQKNLTQSF
jgi:hypothetical protein